MNYFCIRNFNSNSYNIFEFMIKSYEKREFVFLKYSINKLINKKQRMEKSLYAYITGVHVNWTFPNVIIKRVKFQNKNKKILVFFFENMFTLFSILLFVMQSEYKRIPLIHIQLSFSYISLFTRYSFRLVYLTKKLFKKKQPLNITFFKTWFQTII